MMTSDTLSSDEKTFLMETVRRTKGDCKTQASMYDIGNDLGMDKADASGIAEALMGYGCLEIRTLSGGIAVTEAGLDLAVELGAEIGGRKRDDSRALNDRPVLDEAMRAAVETLMTDIKSMAGGLNLDYDAIDELTADLRTVDAQLMSPKPKTSILAACLNSIRNTLKASGVEPIEKRLEILLR